jgi:hypothetical protein
MKRLQLFDEGWVEKSLFDRHRCASL